MALRIANVVLDAEDVKRAAAFWSAALDYEIAQAGDDWTSLRDPRGRGATVGLQPNRERKADVNRVHVDLAAADVDAEVARLERLGARRVPWQYGEGANYVVMADTEGNEFCVFRSGGG